MVYSNINQSQCARNARDVINVLIITRAVLVQVVHGMVSQSQAVTLALTAGVTVRLRKTSRTVRLCVGNGRFLSVRLPFVFKSVQ